MGNHFIRIKKKTRLAAMLTALVFGVGIGVAAASVWLLLAKLLIVPMHAWSYGVCTGAALLAAVTVYIFLKPSDKRLAKRLDEEHGLCERVRTMVAFKEKDDDISRLQRSDTDERLGKIKVSFFRKKQVIAIVAVILIASGSFTGAVLTPQREIPAPEEPTVSSFDKELMIAELSELISTVDKSIMTERHKVKTVEELTGLIEFVKTHDYMSEMKLEAIERTVEINGSLANVNSAPLMGEALAGSTDPLLKEFGAELTAMSGAKTKKLLEDLKDEIESADSSDISFTADELSLALDNVTADSENALVKLLSSLVSAIRGYANGVGDIDDAFAGIPLAFSNEVMIQNVNKMTTQTVISKLCSIFGISPEDLDSVEGGEDIDVRPPSSLSPDEEDTEIEEPDKPIGEGGIGTGDRVYGSNDIIYDPHSNAYVTYGTLLDEYNARATDKILDGRITEDFKKFIEEYFKSLSEYTPPEE